MLPTTFKEQSHKWTPMTRAHVSNAILIVHHFIRTVLDSCCPDPPVREELWNYLLDDLQGRYRRAIQHADFLLKVEFEGRSMTFNPVFDEKLETLRLALAEDLSHEIDARLNGDEDPVTIKRSIQELIKKTHGRTDSISNTRRSIHDVLHTFYGIARSRFVDVVCQQVIDHFLLHAPDGPLAALSEEVVLHMTPEQLEAISGEDMVSRDRREKLTKDVGNLRKALRVLRG